MKKTIIFLTLLAFATPAFGASSTTWTYNKSGKTWTVKTKKLKTTLERIDELKSKPRKTKSKKRTR